MNTPAWMQALALLVWGAMLGQGAAGLALGALLGGLRLIANSGIVRLRLDEAELTRSVDLSAVLAALTLVGLLAARGLPDGLLAAMGWMPALLLPLLLVATLNDAPLRLRHLALSLRRSTRPEAAMVVQADAPYLAITLLASAVQAKPSTQAFWLLAGTLVAWLFVARPPPRRRGGVSFAGAAAVALGIAFAAGQGLERVQVAVEEWFIDALSAADNDPYQSQTRIGDLGRVKLSERIVWRVRQTPPVAVPLLLRTGVFTHYANGAWAARRDAFAPLPEALNATHRLGLRGDSVQGAALLPVPVGVGRIDAPGRLERNPLGVVRITEAPASLEIAIGQDQASAAPPSEGDLALPSGFSGLLEKLPELARLQPADAALRLAGLEAWFAAHFRYTLFIGDEARGRRGLERFLLTDRAGHCEYFATSTVLLLRALGVPARYVTGYSVQEYSRLEQAFVLRQRHSHAWAEAFVDGRWIEVDTTPATWLSVEEQAAPFWQPVLDLASFFWRRAGELRRDALAGEHSGAVWIGLALLLAAMIWQARNRLHTTRQPSTVGAGATAVAAPSAELRAFHALEQQLAGLGLGRTASEAPRNWLARLGRDGQSVLDTARLAAAGRVIEALYRQRYG